MPSTPMMTDAQRAMALEQARRDMMGQATTDVPGSPGNMGHPAMLQYYSQPVTQTGQPYVGGAQPLQAMPTPYDNVVPRVVIGATGISVPDQSHGFLSPFYPDVSIPYEEPTDAKAAIVRALMSGPRPASGKR